MNTQAINDSSHAEPTMAEVNNAIDKIASYAPDQISPDFAEDIKKEVDRISLFDTKLFASADPIEVELLKPLAPLELIKKRFMKLIVAMASCDPNQVDSKDSKFAELLQEFEKIASAMYTEIDELPVHIKSRINALRTTDAISSDDDNLFFTKEPTCEELCKDIDEIPDDYHVIFPEGTTIEEAMEGMEDI